MNTLYHHKSYHVDPVGMAEPAPTDLNYKCPKNE